MKGVLTRNPRFVFGGVVLLVLVLVAAFAPWLAPHDPMEQSLLNQLLPPRWVKGGDPAFFLGTDTLGRDLLSRMIYGTRPALLVMVLGATLSGIAGVLLGMLAGYFGGWLDTAVSRTVDTFMSFPPMLLAIVLAAAMGPGLSTVVISVVLIGWTRFCRVVRGEVLALKEQEFVTSARTIGVSGARVLFHELLPNLLPLIVVLLGLEMGRAIVVEAIMSFIGFSSSGIATWGGIIADARSYINQAWWAMTYPIAAIIVAVLGLNALGDGLRQATDPVLQR
jgi:ABC-type dipeptide/oligopeptide/nickel transport system permease subunit